MCQLAKILVMETNNINQMIGMKIRLERTKRKISQERLAELSELSKNSIGIIERGESSASIETLFKIAKALQITLVELVDISKVDL